MKFYIIQQKSKFKNSIRPFFIKQCFFISPSKEFYERKKWSYLLNLFLIIITIGRRNIILLFA